MSTVHNNTSNTVQASDGIKPNSAAGEMQNTFIQLMVAQVRNQDPTKPVDSNEFLNQFASMSQVQSLENMAALTRQNIALQENLRYMSAAGLLDKTVMVRADQLDLQDLPVQGEIELKHSASDLTVVLSDANGVKTEVQLPACEPGRVAFEIDPLKLGLKPGKYAIEVKSSGGETFEVLAKGKVGNVRQGSAGPVLDVVGVGSVPFNQIVEFSHAPSLANGMKSAAVDNTPRSLSTFT